MLWLIYSLGGGWGHLTRAAALARAASSRYPVRILTNSLYAAQVHGLDIVVVESREAAVAQIEASKTATLIVDTFPRGIGGELAAVLPTLKAAKILIHRDLNPRYVSAASLRDFVASNYDLVLIPGAGEGSEFSGQVTAPWLVRSADELSTANAHGQPIVCASGNAEELKWYGEVAARLPDALCIAPVCPAGCPPERWTRHWPAIDLFPGASVIVGGAGYNTVHEALACQVPLVARPWPRMYDRQSRRAARAAQQAEVTIVTTPDEAVSAAQHRRSAAPCPVRYPNGALRAVSLIESCIPASPEPRASATGTYIPGPNQIT
jgi:UDP-N-acetylglucosamine:LPS N-acetylglucosamine transferase